jgi:hypothetical protein
MPSGDPIYYSDVARAVAPPAGRIVQQSGAAQTGLVDATATAITFGTGSEELDTDGFHDTSTNNTRVTPSVPGWYRIHGGVAFAGQTDVVSHEVRIRKNGSTNLAPASRVAYSASVNGTTQVILCSVLASFNGTTDYFELIGNQDRSGGGNWATTISSQYASTLEWQFVRPL